MTKVDYTTAICTTNKDDLLFRDLGSHFRQSKELPGCSRSETRGKCSNDGFYYNDESTIVICSNGNAHIQPCAPGSKNSAKEHYEKGTTYAYRDFCDVNLVDDGFALKHGYAANAIDDYSSSNVVPKVHVTPKVEGTVVESEVYLGKYQAMCPWKQELSQGAIRKRNHSRLQSLCDVNLVDDGFALNHGAYSDVPHRKEYGMPDAYAYHGSYDIFGNAHVYHSVPVNYGW
ncbi:hypothetical protein CAPTEDRAFT_211893 [Capitella teleta]|uniref:Uncharacterized protein n=1 Tax=Capitella teleta TaxID=283909 RepID=R7U0K1_CAPTE|nr:hypothetical protein CAPTEDRAFT_211893 [Capitella teleta]|eukprot:ELT99367.1 hypothetical protein CAPTEDRAFT_211893 [Capitella teleta]